MTDLPTHSQRPVAVDTADGAVPGLGIGQQTLSEAIYAERLIRAITEQSTSLKTSFESLTKAVEACKEQPQSTENKNDFWAAYKTLADEFDEDFQNKYRNDLDSSLIFAGLFSAVSSAFIIQIQPELQPDPNVITQGLLGLLVHNVTGFPPPPALLPPPVTPVKIVIVAQGILYVSLFLTLLVALLAVLGKEWLLHYNSVGDFERGTIERRGVERQHKFNGIQQWKFEFVMKMFPLLLQFALLLFATALSTYLWTIHHAIASIVLGLTALGIILYVAMIISALISQYSPFQTSLTLLLRTIFKARPKPLALNSGKFVPTPGTFAHLWSSFSQCWSTGTTAPLRPGFQNTGSSKRSEIFNTPDPLQSSDLEKIAAVIWAMEISTNPAMVHSAAEMVPKLQWPANLDVQPSLERLSDTFRTCFEESTVRNGMDDRAIACIKAFGVLEMVTDQPKVSTDLWTFPRKEIKTTSAELRSLVLMFHMKRDSYEIKQPPHLTQWSLRFIAAENLPPTEHYLQTIFTQFRPQDVPEKGESIVADYLFCLNSFLLTRTAARHHSLLDKSECLGSLTADLFENLAQHLKDNPHLIGNPHPTDNPPSVHIIIELLTHMSRIVDMVRSSYRLRIDQKCIKAAYDLCAIPDLPQEAIMRILHIVRVDPTALQHLEYENPDVGWVYTNLVDHKKPSRAFLGDLLLVLIRYRRFRGQPPKDALHAIISALSPQSDINDPDEEHTQLTRRASVVLCSADHWFTDNNLRSQLMEDSVWLILSEQHLPKYTSLGVKLLQQQEWKAIIQKYPHCWLNQYPRIIGLKGHQGRVNNKYKKFQFVLSNLWEAQNAKAAQFVKEKTLVIVFMVLADAWKKVDSFNARATLSLLECTVEASFSVRVIELDVQYPSDPFIKEIISRLGNAVARAGERAIQVINKPNTDMDLEESAIQVINKPRADMDLEDKVHGVAKFLSDLAFVINGELKNPAEKYTDRDEEGKHWQRLRDTFRARMVVLRTT